MNDDTIILFMGHLHLYTKCSPITYVICSRNTPLRKSRNIPLTRETINQGMLHLSLVASLGPKAL